MENPIIESVAAAVVVAVGLYFVALGALALFSPVVAKRFLLGFASSALAHYTELLVRVVVGGAFLVHAPDMLFPVAFKIFGWVLIVTTACLFLVPWQWHRRFAEQAVPLAIRYIAPIGAASLVFGILVLTAIIRGTID